MRKFFAVAMGSLVALAGFAGMASASATIDLMWIDVTNTNTAGNPICLLPAQRNCGPDLRSPDSGVTVSSVLASDSLTLAVIVTAGPNGFSSGGVSVDYTDALPKLSVTGFQSFDTTKPLFYLPSHLGVTFNSPDGWVQNINAASGTPLAGIGLPAGGTAYLGTVTFHKDQLQNGTFEIAVGVNGPAGSDGLASNNPLANISATSTYNSAFLVNVPEPGALSLLVMGLGGMLLAGRGRS